MFVDITDFKSVLAVENFLIPYKRGRLAQDKKSYLPKEKITPEVCFDVLRSTNAPRNIKDMLECIAELPASEQAQFKDVVLATFSNREQPNKQPHNILLLGKKLAATSGYEEELAEAQKLQDGEFLHSSSKLDKSFVSFKNDFKNVDFSAYEKVICLSDKEIQFLEGVKFPKNLEIPNSSDVSFAFYFRRNASFLATGSDLTGVQSMLFKEGAKVDLSKAQNLPPQLDVSMCADVRLLQCDLKDQPNLRFKDGARVDLSKAQNLPPQLDVSTCSEVELCGCDLSQQNLCFREGASVVLEKIQNVPVCPDFSKCQKVVLYDSDFKNYFNLCFRDGAKVDLIDIDNLPTDVDFSRCSAVKLVGCDLKDQPNLRFKEGARVELRDVENLSPDVDFSVCSEVELFGENLHLVSPLVFREGAVRLNFANVQSPQIDFSKCAELTLNHCNLQNVECLIFKNWEQMKESGFQRPDKWNGKLVFVDEQQLLQAGKDIDKEKTVSAKDEDGLHAADEKSSAEKSSAHSRWGGLVGKIFGKGGR